MGSSAANNAPKRSRLAGLFDDLHERAMAEPSATPTDVRGRELADWTVRVVATCIDVVLVTLVESAAKAISLSSIQLFVFDWLLVGGYLCVIAWRGVTVGNLLTKTKVVDASSGEVLTFRRAVIRALSLLGLLVTLIGAGMDVLLPLVDRKRQTLHDKAASSLVIRTGRLFPAMQQRDEGDDRGD